MLSAEARIGVKVRVFDSYRIPHLRGVTGIIEQMYGHPDYRALDVRLENGRSELFWHYELEHERMLHGYSDGLA